MNIWDVAEKTRIFSDSSLKIMPRAGITGSIRLLPKVELIPRRNSVVFLASDCFSKVEFFLRRNITVLLSDWPSSSFFSVVGEGVTEV